MKDRMQIADELLKKDCYLIDFLPMKVSKNSKGQFFAVESHLLGSKYDLIKVKFSNLILKLMCYYRITMLWYEWLDEPTPGNVELAISDTVKKHSQTLEFLFLDENMLLVFDPDYLNLAVYNPSKKARKLFKQLAWSEGLFWRSSNK